MRYQWWLSRGEESKLGSWPSGLGIDPVDTSIEHNGSQVFQQWKRELQIQIEGKL